MDQLAFDGTGKYGNVVLIRKTGTEGSKVPLVDRQSVFGRYDYIDQYINNLAAAVMEFYNEMKMLSQYLT